MEHISVNIGLYHLLLDVEALYLATECVYGFKTIRTKNDVYLPRHNIGSQQIMKKRCVFCETVTDFFKNIILMNFMHKILNTRSHRHHSKITTLVLNSVQFNVRLPTTESGILELVSSCVFFLILLCLVTYVACMNSVTLCETYDV